MSFSKNGAKANEEYVRFIHRLADESAKVIKPYFAALNFEVEIKEDETPVTLADRQAEALMRDLIRREFPDHGIIGEEYGSENEGAEFVWILDPIDGTISFASGCPLFGTLICLLHEDRPILGAINQPILDILCLGDNHRTSVNGRRVQMRTVAELAEATLLTTDVLSIPVYQDEASFGRLSHEVKYLRTWGDCYGYLLLACGGADIMLDPIMNPWDIIPVIPIIHGAGGVVTTWAGGDAVRGTSCAAANKELHPIVMEILNE